MKVEVFMQSTFRERERDVLRHMYKGIKQDLIADELGDEDVAIIKRMNKAMGLGTGVEFNYDDRGNGRYDLGVIFGSWKPERKSPHHAVRSEVAQSDKPFLCIETQLLGRVMFQESEYHRVGVNGFLNEAAIFGLEKKYESDRFEKLGFNYKGWRKEKGDKIVIALQLPGDASLRGMDINEWCVWVLNQITPMTDRPIEIRTHPGLSAKGVDAHLPVYQYLAFNNIKNVTFVSGKYTPWDQQILDARCVIAFTSGLSIDAVLNGVPVIAGDPGNFTWGISSQDVKQFENPYIEDEGVVQDWLNTLAYCQWSKEEMASGEAWAHLKQPVHFAIDEYKKENESS